mgnify:CR=1 FL=1
MRFSLTFWDISLWLAITAIILLATSELISPYYRQTSLIIEKKRLRQIALLLGVLFMFTVLVRVYSML